MWYIHRHTHIYVHINKPDRERHKQYDLTYTCVSFYTQTPLMKWRRITCIRRPMRDHRHKSVESSVGDKEAKQLSWDCSATALFVFAADRFIPQCLSHSTISRPPQVTEPTVMCQIISEKSRNSKARRPPEGALSLPSWSLGSFQQTQRAPKWAFDQWRPGWYW